eukprot:m.180920 g.180920  ORF g.180920 m.180920 type:complete len:352 (+) comp14660_c2_seq2:607-1662(+)
MATVQLPSNTSTTLAGEVPVKRSVLGNIGNSFAAGALRAKKAKTTFPAPSVPQEQPIAEEQLEDAMDTREEQLAVDAAIEDIDADDFDNPQMVSEYTNDIYAYLLELEDTMLVPADYLDRQTEVNARMRAILVDWLVEVGNRFELLQETVYMTIDIVDRYLSVEQTSRRKLQLVGVTAMLLASKFEEMFPPEVGDFVYISDNAYTREEILSMERKMLETLNFRLGKPLALHFLRRDSKAGHADATMHTVAKYLMELTLCQSTMLQFKASEIAAAATYVAREIVGEPDVWTKTIEAYSTYTLDSITPCIEALRAVLKGSIDSRQQAVRSKFAKSKFMRISQLPELNAYIERL